MGGFRLVFLLCFVLVFGLCLLFVCCLFVVLFAYFGGLLLSCCFGVFLGVVL